MTRTRQNPFTPVFGRIPPFMAGREHVLNEIESAFDMRGANPDLCTLFVGARGTGKTALLAYLSREASMRGWVTANVSCVPGMLEDIIEQALSSSKPFVEQPDDARIKSISIGQLFGAEWEYRDSSSGNWRTRMTALINSLNEQGLGLLITVDEVKANNDEMVQLASVFQHFIREERTVALLMAGLPAHVSALVSDESISFLRRAKVRQLGRIPDSEIAAALRKTIETYGRRIDDAALDLAVKSIEGFPFLMQLVGFRLWAENPEEDIITKSDALTAIPLAQEDFENSVLNATYRELSNGDLDFLGAMLEDDSSSSISDIAERMGKTSSYVRVYKKRLVEQGIITEERRGHVRFELPHFKDYLRERL